jgi:putative ABC transport system permease protein
MLHQIASIFRFLFRRPRIERDLDAELGYHLDRLIEQNVAKGMSPDNARRQALLTVGGIQPAKEECRDARRGSLVEAFLQDIRYGVRVLGKNPGFTAAAVLTLALGIGANTAIFQLLDAVRMRLLPVRDPQQLVEVRFPPNTGRSGRFNSPRPILTNPQWEQIRAPHEPFSSIFAWSTRRFNLAPHGEGRYIEGLWVGGEFFETLGVQALRGRLLTAADDRRGCGAPAAVLSYPFWQREYGGSDTAIGGKLTLYGHPFEIIGVTPPSFFGVEVGRTFDVAIPLCSEPLIAGADSVLDNRQTWWLASMGRLKPGWSAERATAWLRTISPRIFQVTLPNGYRPETTKAYLELKLAAYPAGDGVSSLRSQYVNPLWLLLGLAALVLLIACANLANLMLARASAREREMAVRLALGAARGRLVRQLLAESLLLAAAGATLGFVLAQNLSRALISFLSTGNNPLFVDLAPDWRVLGFTAGLAIFTCVVFGLTPALRATVTEPGSVMKGSGRGLTANRDRFSLRRILVVSQVALSLVLLVGALLFVRSLRNLMTTELGFRQDNMLSVNMDIERANLSPERRREFHRDLLQRIRQTPGVASAAETMIVPMSGDGWNDNVGIQGHSPNERGKLVSNFTRISGGYFQAMGTPLLAGRDFSSEDTTASPQVAIVNESFAREFLKGANPVGVTFSVEGDPSKPEPKYLIVGLVKDSKYRNVREDFGPISYLASSQEEEPDKGALFVIRSQGPLEAMIPTIKRTFMEYDPEIKLNLRIMKSQVRDTLLQERLMATLSGFFGLLAAILATIGLYGVISYMVARRRNEIGIRIALGADRGAVIGLVLREATLLLAVGLAIGTAVSAATGSIARSMLYGLQPHDPVTIAMAAAILGTVAVVASYLPARRAASLDPVTALRDE